MYKLTFYMQVNMVFRGSKRVPGNAGVFAFVLWLSYLNLQSTIVMQDVRVSIQGAGSAVFKPKTQRVNNFVLCYRKDYMAKFCWVFLNSPLNFGNGWPKRGAVHEGWAIFDDLVDLVGWRQHSGWLICSEPAQSIYGLLLSTKCQGWEIALKSIMDVEF